jgi:MYXO-CTERM domain-containing protein
MKNLIKLAVATACLSGVSQGATVVVATGLGGTTVQGVTLEIGPVGVLTHTVLLDSTSYYVGVGTFASGVFTPWARLALDTVTGSPTREVSGSFTSTTSGAFDGQAIRVFVGTLSAVGNPASAAVAPNSAFTPIGDTWAVFGSTGTANFPTSSGATSQTFNMTTQAGLSVVATGNVGNGWNGTSSTSGSATNYYTMVPEPSAALLGAIGALGLLRRRRN